MYPTKHARMNTVKCDTKLEGATSPRPQKARPPRTNGNQLDFFSSSLADGVVFSAGSSFFTGVADNFGAGGGKVISPSFVTVAPRIASSSKFIVLQ